MMFLGYILSLHEMIPFFILQATHGYLSAQSETGSS